MSEELLPDGQWTIERAYAWKAQQPWVVGCNFIPSTAINQIEVWQADSFDLSTIRFELGLAASLGMNAVRVFLHDLVHESTARLKFAFPGAPNQERRSQRFGSRTYSCRTEPRTAKAKLRCSGH